MTRIPRLCRFGEFRNCRMDTFADRRSGCGYIPPGRVTLRRRPARPTVRAGPGGRPAPPPSARLLGRFARPFRPPHPPPQKKRLSRQITVTATNVVPRAPAGVSRSARNEVTNRRQGRHAIELLDPNLSLVVRPVFLDKRSHRRATWSEIVNLRHGWMLCRKGPKTISAMCLVLRWVAC